MLGHDSVKQGGKPHNELSAEIKIREVKIREVEIQEVKIREVKNQEVKINLFFKAPSLRSCRTLCFWGRIMLLVLRVCDWRSVWLTFCVIAHFNFLSLSQCHISLLWPLLNAKFRHYRTLILSHFNSLALQLSCNHIYFKISKLNTSCILTVQTTPQLCWH